jgi:tRNA-dihydrouridine synthase 1
MAAFEHTLALLEKAIKRGLQEYEANPEKFEPNPNETLKGSKATIAEYGRPWWVCQPHVRPLPEEAFETGALREKGSKPVPKGEKEEIKDSGDANASTSDGTVTPGDSAATPTTSTKIDPLVSG